MAKSKRSLAGPSPEPETAPLPDELQEFIGTTEPWQSQDQQAQEQQSGRERPPEPTQLPAEPQRPYPRNELDEFLGREPTNPAPLPSSRPQTQEHPARMHDPRPGTYVPGQRPKHRLAPLPEVPANRTQRTRSLREERRAPPRENRPTREQAAEKRTAQRAMPKMRAEDLGKDLTQGVIDWIERHEVRPDFRAVRGALIVATKLLKRRWKLDVLGG